MKTRSDFTATFTVHAALRLAKKHKLFAKDARLKKTVEKLLGDLESDRTIFGRQLKMLTMMKSGATVDDMRRKLRCSRRTVFRYLNHLEAAGVGITLEGQAYRVSSGLLKALS
jgi:hypothetical protein